MASKLLTAALAAAVAANAGAPQLEERQAAEWAQCGGIGFSGPTTCASGLACVVQNSYYSQCLPASQAASSSSSKAQATTKSNTAPPSSSSSPAAPAGSGPCDIYAAGGTPCAAAHSTTRALYAKYNGPLYQVQKANGQTKDISTVAPGGIADSAAQDAFCSGTTCVISQIYDQSPNGNHLGEATGYWKGPGPNGYDKLASATGAPIYLGGKKVYGVFIAPGYGYRRSNCKGTVTGNNAEGMYDVIDGTHYNQWCCFDYGNSEVSGTDTGSGHMMAIYFGDSTQWGSGSGSGPWIMTDIENGLFSGYSPKTNPEQPINHRFVTAMLRGAATNHFDIRGGDATTGSLTYYVNSSYPAGYYPMHREGAIILGTGGDNSNSGQGTWYEGAMTVGYPSDAAQDAVQANIVAARYSTSSSSAKHRRSPFSLEVGSSVSLLSATSPTMRRRGTDDNNKARYLVRRGSAIHIDKVSAAHHDETSRKAATWTVRAGLGNPTCVSLEAADEPGTFLLRTNEDHGAGLVAARRDGTREFDHDATFCPHAGLDGQSHTVTLQSWSEPNYYVRHHAGAAWAARNGGHRDCDASAEFVQDASWVVLPGF